MRESFIKELIANIKCGVCGELYESGNIRVLGYQEDLWFLSVSCSACHTQALVAAVVREESVEVMTDLKEEEYAKFAEMKPVSGNEVLDMHEFLKNFTGDVSDVLSMK